MPQQPTITTRSPLAPTSALGRGGVVAGLALAVTVGLGACGRTGPVDALPEGDGDPDIAGVSVTSPDAVVETEPTVEPQELESTVTEQTAPEPAPNATTYVVQSGDTLSGIATTFGITVDELAGANGLIDVDSITPGDELVIPMKPVEVSVVDTGQTSTTAPPTTPPPVTQP